MWRLALLLLLTVPALDLWLLLQIGAAIGPMPTLLLVAGAAFGGMALARAQGLRLLRDPPPHPWMEGLLVVVGGILLVTPGLLTDVAGLVLLVPSARRWLAPRAVRLLAPEVGEPHVTLGDPPQPSRTATAAPHPFSSPFDDLP
jgi:UPF0716 protein FxsA